MPEVNSVVNQVVPPLLTVEGRVTVHFLDGQSVEGEYKAQDALNIFLLVSGQPLMIPRTQIRYVKGEHARQLVIDTSPAQSGKAELQEAAPQPSPTADDEEGTIVIPPPDDLSPSTSDTGQHTAVNLASASPPPVEKDEDGTLVLDFDETSEEAMDDEGTFVLPPLHGEDDSDRTDVLIPVAEEDDSDTTIVVPVEDKRNQVSATLVCTSGPHAGDEFELKSGITTIGRSSDNVLVLSKDKEISRHHAILVQESGQFVVQDQNSLNGTFVNDEPVTGPHYLKHGDLILVGLSTLRYEETKTS